MVDVHYYHRIPEPTHRTMNPLTPERLTLVGEICGLRQDLAVLDLARGKGEMLWLFAAKFGASGVGSTSTRR